MTECATREISLAGEVIFVVGIVAILLMLVYVAVEVWMDRPSGPRQAALDAAHDQWEADWADYEAARAASPDTPSEWLHLAPK
jgi:hypothetical protein